MFASHSAVPSAGRQRLSQAELDIILYAHERFIGGRPGGKRASLRFVDFSGLNFEQRILDDADLSASVFEGCLMVGVRMERANLFGSDLRKADLRGAIL